MVIFVELLTSDFCVYQGMTTLINQVHKIKGHARVFETNLKQYEYVQPNYVLWEFLFDSNTFKNNNN
jgi:hypothetical protein